MARFFYSFSPVCVCYCWDFFLHLIYWVLVEYVVRTMNIHLDPLNGVKKQNGVRIVWHEFVRQKRRKKSNNDAMNTTKTSTQLYA